MKTISNFLAMVVLTIGVCTVHVSAEERQKGSEQTASESKIQVLNQNITSIQTQIDALEKKGEENLSDKEIDKYLELQDQLLAAKDEIIAAENEKQEIENEKQVAYGKVLKTLDSIKHGLPPSDSSK